MLEIVAHQRVQSSGLGRRKRSNPLGRRGEKNPNTQTSGLLTYPCEVWPAGLESSVRDWAKLPSSLFSAQHPFGAYQHPLNTQEWGKTTIHIHIHTHIFKPMWISTCVHTKMHKYNSDTMFIYIKQIQFWTQKHWPCEFQNSDSQDRVTIKLSWADVEALTCFDQSTSENWHISLKLHFRKLQRQEERRTEGKKRCQTFPTLGDLDVQSSAD